MTMLVLPSMRKKLTLQRRKEKSEGNLHVGQKFRQVRCAMAFDISIEQHSTHENITQWSDQEA